MATYAFSGGVAAVKGAGQKNKFRFGGTWAAGDTWSAQVTSQISGDFTLGKGNIAGKVFLSCLTFKDRAILGYLGGFAISAIDDPTGWEEQNIGSAVFPFSNTYGIVDSVVDLGTTTGRLYTFGRATIQSWSTDADPSKWVLSQIIDNSGTPFGGSVQSVGEVDIYYVDRTGVRSIQTKELTGDAFVGDIGTPVDSLVVESVKQVEENDTAVVSYIQPTTKNYCVWLADYLYNFAKYPLSKISAWSRHEATWCNTPSAIVPVGVFNGSGQLTVNGFTASQNYVWYRDSGPETAVINGSETISYDSQFTAQGTSVTLVGPAGVGPSSLFIPVTAFTPIKSSVVGGAAFLYGSDNYLYRYDLIADSQIDYTQATVITPWLQVNGGKQCQFEAIEISCVGRWAVLYSVNPRTANDTLAIVTSNNSVPTVENSSTTELRRYAISGNGSTIRLKFISVGRVEVDDDGNVIQPKLCAAAVVYKPSNEK